MTNLELIKRLQEVCAVVSDIEGREEDQDDIDFAHKQLIFVIDELLNPKAPLVFEKET